MEKQSGNGKDGCKFLEENPLTMLLSRAMNIDAKSEAVIRRAFPIVIRNGKLRRNE